MLNPRYKKYAERLKELIEESMKIAALERNSEFGPYIKEVDILNSWLIKVKNIIGMTFGVNSLHFIKL